MKNSLHSALLGVVLALGLSHGTSAQDNAATYVVTYIEVSPSSIEQAMELIATEAEGSRGDAGNLLFESLQRINRPNHFVLLQTWVDLDAQQSHRDSARTTGFREALAPLLYSPYDERLHVQVQTDAQLGEPGADAVYAVTHVDVTPANVEPALEYLHAVAPASRDESGNHRFDVLVQSSRTNHFTVVERWESAQAQQEHVDAPHSRSFREGIYPLAGALYDERLYRAL